MLSRKESEDATAVQKCYYRSELAGRVSTKVDKIWTGLASKSANQIKNCGEYRAQNDRGHQREIKSRVLAAIKDISRKAPQRQMRASEPHKHEAQNQQNDAENNQNFAEISHT